jgi:hypothetical protein
MDYKERRNLKARIEADLQLLADECWDSEITRKLEEVLEELQSIYLEGYDD